MCWWAPCFHTFMCYCPVQLTVQPRNVSLFATRALLDFMELACFVHKCARGALLTWSVRLRVSRLLALVWGGGWFQLHAWASGSAGCWPQSGVVVDFNCRHGFLAPQAAGLKLVWWLFLTAGMCLWLRRLLALSWGGGWQACAFGSADCWP